jgi:hypothetical protein
MTYVQLKNTYKSPYTPKNPNKEDFFVSYAVNGGIANSAEGIRYGMPSLYPMIDSPVVLPSPLNTRWRYIPPMSYVGVI